MTGGGIADLDPVRGVAVLVGISLVPGGEKLGNEEVSGLHGTAKGAENSDYCAGSGGEIRGFHQEFGEGNQSRGPGQQTRAVGRGQPQVKVHFFAGRVSEDKNV